LPHAADKKKNARDWQSTAGVLNERTAALNVLLDGVADLLLGLAQLCLQAPEQFVFLALGKEQVVIGQLSVFLLQFAFDLVPLAFEE
jgi:hypothetical protein